MYKSAVIVPFYNEIRRFDVNTLNYFLTDLPRDCLIIFVDDGSKDDLGQVILAHVTNIKLQNFQLLSYPKNQGKAFALQLGFNYVRDNEKSVTHIGILDSDFSAHPRELNRLFEIAKESNADLILGSRLRTKSNLIQSSKFRFVVGRIFAFLVNTIFDFNLYDTQCGCKVMKVDPDLYVFCGQKMVSPWLFDLQYLITMRKIKKTFTYKEIPLCEWKHKGESKISVFSTFSLLKGLIQLKQFESRSLT